VKAGARIRFTFPFYLLTSFQTKRIERKKKKKTGGEKGKKGKIGGHSPPKY